MVHIHVMPCGCVQDGDVHNPRSKEKCPECFNNVESDVDLYHVYIDLVQFGFRWNGLLLATFTL